MTSFRFLVLSLILFISLRCSHSDVAGNRYPNNLKSQENCSRQLSQLSDRKAKELKESRVLPPAEVKTLEPLSPQNYDTFSKEKKLTLTTYNVLNLKQMVGRFEPDINTGVRQNKT
ncbi:hypothetical protein EBQ74_10970 [bacterium]|nr:hypothetical protein [bacterium]